MKYLDAIKQSFTDFYCNDKVLLEEKRKVYELTFSFRLAHYLANKLECGSSSLKIDREYFGDIHDLYTKRKTIEGKQVIPDIIFHDRNDQNEFCLEIKWESMGGDKEKIEKIVNKYHYKEGYCLYNITKNGYTLYCLNSNTSEIKNYNWID